MNSKLRVLEALDVLYMQGEDAGKSNYGSAVHQITAVTEAEKAIRQAVGEEMLELVGADVDPDSAPTDRAFNNMIGVNIAKAELRQKIKQWAALKETTE